MEEDSTTEEENTTEEEDSEEEDSEDAYEFDNFKPHSTSRSFIIRLEVECELKDPNVKNPVFHIFTRCSYLKSFDLDECSEITKVKDAAKVIKKEYPVDLDFIFGVKQTLKINLCDVLPENAEKFDTDLGNFDRRVGTSLISYSKIFGAMCNSKPIEPIPLTHGEEEVGRTTLRVLKIEDDSYPRKMLLFSIRASGIPKMDVVGKGDPYFEMKEGGGGRSHGHLLYRSEVVKNTDSPFWQEVLLPQLPIVTEGDKMNKFLEGLKGSDDDDDDDDSDEECGEKEKGEELMKELKRVRNESENKKEEEEFILFDVHDWDKHTDDDFIGDFEIPIPELLSKSENKILEAPLHAFGNRTGRGTLSITYKPLLRHDFFETYLVKRNLKLDISIAIDFSKSRNNKSKKLHRMVEITNDPDITTTDDDSMKKTTTSSRSFLNPYHRCLFSICDILGGYSDDKFQVFGYGHKSKDEPFYTFTKDVVEEEEEEVSSSSTQNRLNYLSGAEEVMRMYEKEVRDKRKQMMTKSPKLKPLIDHVCSQARRKKEARRGKNLNQDDVLLCSSYSVLFILTGGDCEDLKESIDSMISSSFLPMSIVIIGMGGNAKKEFKGLVSRYVERKFNELDLGKNNLFRKPIRQNVLFVDHDMDEKESGYVGEYHWDGFVAEAVTRIPNDVEEFFAMEP